VAAVLVVAVAVQAATVPAAADHAVVPADLAVGPAVDLVVDPVVAAVVVVPAPAT